MIILRVINDRVSRLCEKIEIPRINWRLKPSAVPHKFPNCPKYLSKNVRKHNSPTKRTVFDTKAATVSRLQNNDLIEGGLQNPTPDNSFPFTSNIPVRNPESLHSSKTACSCDAQQNIISLKKRIKNLNRNSTKVTK